MVTDEGWEDGGRLPAFETATAISAREMRRMGALATSGVWVHG